MYLPWLNSLDGTKWPEVLHPYLVYTQPTPDGLPSKDWEHLPHALTLYQTIIDLNAQVVVELGTRKGKSLHIIVEALKQTHGHLWSIDLVKCEPPLEPSETSYVTFIVSDSRTVRWWQPINLLFSDASHNYEETKDELDKFWPYVTTPGVVIVSDTDSHWEAKQAVTDWAERNKVGYVLDCRGQGATYLIKPTVPAEFRDELGTHYRHMWSLGRHK